MLRSHALFTSALSPLRQLTTSRATTCWARTRWASTATSSEDAADETVKATGRRVAKGKHAVAADEGQDAAQKKKRGRPRKTPAADEQTKPTVIAPVPSKDSATDPSPSCPRRRRASKQSQSDLPPRLAIPASTHHTSLPTFLAYARQKRLNPTGNVYRGTHYEYTCMRTLSGRNYDFELYRTGKAGDLGVDLVGWWKLPEYASEGKGRAEGEEMLGSELDEGEVGTGRRRRKTWRRLKVLAQCKIGAPRPAMIRELEGAYVGAPAGWSSSLALLISTNPATKGVLAALQRSRWPMGLLQVTREGDVKQFLWNAVARESGLEGVGAVLRYERVKGKGKAKEEEEEGGEDGKGGVGVGVRQSVRLSWMGRVWRA